jgi:DNA repair protein RecN (Recombination protein N)
LADLGMGKCRFEVSIEPTDPGPTGSDKLEFLISPNPGEPVRPLMRIASGGELSRIMLALRTITTSADVPTVIFDEIDAGIGGLTAQTLGDKIAALSGRKQVLCVTHLAQVASKAASHFCVTKDVVNGSSVVLMSQLDGEDRITEIARMLGGTRGSEVALLHAREMLSLAHQRNS